MIALKDKIKKALKRGLFLFCTQRGFTLTEVLVVVVFIAILASITMPRMFGTQEKMRIAEARNMLSALRRAAGTYYDENGTFVDWNPAGGNGIGTNVDGSGHCNDQVRQDFEDVLGIALPQCNDNVYWEYSAYSRAGDSVAFYALRRSVSLDSASDPGKLILLLYNPSTGVTSWSGTGAYAIGGVNDLPSD